MTMFSPCAVVPTLNHVQVLDRIIGHLVALGLPVYLVDDGSDPGQAQKIRQIANDHAGVTLLRHEVNRGKGAAILAALAAADGSGYTHAIQVDADGQHDLGRVADLLAMAQARPEALVTGVPIYDDSVPQARKLGRWITHVWVSINTLSWRMIDSMCGFRVYPVRASLAVVRRAPVALGMAFDTEILVRLHWQGTPVETLPIAVTYPAGNHSNFRLWQDNVQISWMHARLFGGMLWRSPRLVWRKWRRVAPDLHWSGVGERGSYLGLRLLAAIYRLFGRRVCLALMAPVVAVFFLTGQAQRRASMDYLARARRFGLLDYEPGLVTGYRHFMSFAAAALDKFAAWNGNIPVSQLGGDDGSHFTVTRKGNVGAVILTAHMGNPEVIRALADLNQRKRINVLMHTSHARHFKRLIGSAAAGSAVRVIEVTELGPETAIRLQQAVDDGEWVVISADRTPIGSTKVAWISLLGDPAPLPQGPYILASILKVPVHALFCRRTAAGHEVVLEPFAERIELPRGRREAAVHEYAGRFAAMIETHLRHDPLQWYNFFNFWHPPGMTPPEKAPAQTKATS